MLPYEFTFQPFFSLQIFVELTIVRTRERDRCHYKFGSTLNTEA
ncbi:hypothetical protein H1P_4880002 [Hyella patelloides LEGE 07179]|uniref:Uncharacterized protein n=1 Tax=Hyella patelloides LEGE 07179 TaxID=945734 RepID=A0A563VZL9_9CYAN|nr:hypothetical protein [Hyella patelloides]VEP16713.1 hypothetical protein H1P_4880002 [Hyella patelloides LEGE 07179]